MSRGRWITVFWPGLTQLWLAGAWWGLAVACGFAWLFNVAFVSTFVWSELIEPPARAGLWVLVAVVWCLAVGLSWRQLQGAGGQPEPKTVEDLFRRAQREYLIGNWVEAEQLLTQLVRINQKDIDAQLMLASLLRRTGQWTEASQRLRRLEATDGAEKWQSEIARERRLLEERLQTEGESEAENRPNENSEPDNQQSDEQSPTNQAA